jgi:hypothetical protein
MNRWINEIDNITTEFHERFGHLDSSELNWKPEPSTWSIAQNIDHLITINSTYFPVLDAVRKGNYSLAWTGRIGFLVNFFGKAILRGVQPQQRRKSKTFPIWEPSTSAIPGDILKRFRLHQDALKAAIISSESLLEHGTVIASPANKYIVYKLDAAFDIIVAHEYRHLQQAQQMLALMNQRRNS